MAPRKGQPTMPQITTPEEPVTHLAIQDLDTEALREAQAESGNNSLSVLDLEVFTPCHPDKGLSLDSTRDFAIIHHHAGRVYYDGPYDESGTAPKLPPQCVSWDGLYGEGDPGGECKSCPLGQFGGPCKPIYHIYGLEEESYMPVRIVIPRTSLSTKPGSPPKPKFFSNYAMTIRKPLSAFMVRIGVRLRGVGKAGKVVTFEEGPPIDAAVSSDLKMYAAGFRAMMGFPALAAPMKQLEDPTQRERIVVTAQDQGTVDVTNFVDSDEEDDDLFDPAHDPDQDQHGPF
jgi:hypothetical protein